MFALNSTYFFIMYYTMHVLTNALILCVLHIKTILLRFILKGFHIQIMTCTVSQLIINADSCWKCISSVSVRLKLLSSQNNQVLINNVYSLLATFNKLVCTFIFRKFQLNRPSKNKLSNQKNIIYFTNECNE